jgi:hypothetical protein
MTALSPLDGGLSGSLALLVPTEGPQAAVLDINQTKTGAE